MVVYLILHKNVLEDGFFVCQDILNMGTNYRIVKGTETAGFDVHLLNGLQES